MARVPLPRRTLRLDPTTSPLCLGPAPGNYHRRGVVGAYACWDDALTMPVVLLFLGQGPQFLHVDGCVCAYCGKEDAPKPCLRDFNFSSCSSPEF